MTVQTKCFSHSVNFNRIRSCKECFEFLGRHPEWGHNWPLFEQVVVVLSDSFQCRLISWMLFIPNSSTRVHEIQIRIVCGNILECFTDATYIGRVKNRDLPAFTSYISVSRTVKSKVALSIWCICCARFPVHRFTPIQSMNRVAFVISVLINHLFSFDFPSLSSPEFRIEVRLLNLMRFNADVSGIPRDKRIWVQFSNNKFAYKPFLVMLCHLF